MESYVILELLFLSLFSFSFLVLVNWLGKLVSPAFISRAPGNPFFSFFIESLIGLISFITVYSCISIGFRTISLGFLLCGCIVFYIRRREVNYLDELRFRIRSVPLNPLWFALAGSMILTCLSLCFPFSSIRENDMVFYSKLSYHLSASGQENAYIYFNGLSDEFNGTNPYHYFELWICNLYIQLLQFYFPHIILLKYGCYAFLKILVLMGVLSLVEIIRPVKWMDLIAVIVLLLIGVRYLTESISVWPPQYSMWLKPHYAVSLIFFIPFIYFMLKEQIAAAFLFLCLLTIATIVAAPAVYLGIGMYFIVEKIRKNSSGSLYVILVSAVSFTLFILAFYFLTGNKIRVASSEFFTFQQMFEHNIRIWKAIVFMTASFSISALIMILLPFVLIYFFVRSDRSRLLQSLPPVLAVLCIALSGILFFQAITFIENSNQFSDTGYLGAVILFILLFYYLLSLQKRKYFLIPSLVIIVLHLGLGSLHMYKLMSFPALEGSIAAIDLKRTVGISKEYIKQVDGYLSGKGKIKGGFIYDEKDYASLNTSLKWPLVYQLGYYITYFNSYAELMPMTSMPAVEQNTTHRKITAKINDLTRILPFYGNYDRVNEDGYYKKYIVENGIAFLVLSRNFNVERLGYLNISRHFIDENTGEQFVVLN